MTTKSATATFGNYGQIDDVHHPELSSHIAADTTFPTTYLRAVAAIASQDGILNIADFAALNDVTLLLNDSALAKAVLLEFVERPINLKVAMQELMTASAGLDRHTAALAFRAVQPLLAIQGPGSRNMAKAFAYALHHDCRPTELESFPADEQSIWSKVSESSARLVKGRKYAGLRDLCLRTTGDLTLHTSIRDFENGAMEKTEMFARVTAACARVNDDLASFNQRIADMEATRDMAQAFLDSTYALRKQVRQRLAVADARIEFERISFIDDIEEHIHDAGNAFERDVVERLATDQWKRASVWESIAKTTFGKELERRVNRVISRREDSLSLIKEDLRVFQEEIALSRSTILQRLHHTQLAAESPGLRWTTRILNGVETTAETALTVGGVAILGAGAAAYMLGAAVVLPVVAPAAPFVGGAMLVAGALKWLMNSAERKSGEIGHHREKFETAFRIQLIGARDQLISQLEQTSRQFHETAERLVQPLVLEAQAAVRLHSLHLKVAGRINSHAQKSISEILKKISV